MDATRLARAFDVVREQVQRGDIPVAALGVADREGIVRVEAFSPTSGPAAAADSLFPIASITKPIVATAILQLVEAGRLSLGAPLAAYLPEFAAEPPGPNLPGRDLVTTWHLLTHTSGIADPPRPPSRHGWYDRAQLLELALRAPLRFVPGSQYAYSSVTFYLLGELLRRRGGLDYPDHLRERIFRPLGMADTSFDPSTVEAAGRVVWPRFLGAQLTENDEIARGFISTVAPGGGLWSTAADLLAFGRAMLNGGQLDGVRIVGPRSVDLMTREHTAAVREHGVPERDPGYGLGWAVHGLGGRSPLSQAAFGHGGATGSLLVVDPELDFVFVYLANQWGGPSRPSEEALGAVAAAAG